MGSFAAGIQDLLGQSSTQSIGGRGQSGGQDFFTAVLENLITQNLKKKEARQKSKAQLAKEAREFEREILKLQLEAQLEDEKAERKAQREISTNRKKSLFEANLKSSQTRNKLQKIDVYGDVDDGSGGTKKAKIGETLIELIENPDGSFSYRQVAQSPNIPQPTPQDQIQLQSALQSTVQNTPTQRGGRGFSIGNIPLGQGIVPSNNPDQSPVALNLTQPSQSPNSTLQRFAGAGDTIVNRLLSGENVIQSLIPEPTFEQAPEGILRPITKREQRNVARENTPQLSKVLKKLLKSAGVGASAAAQDIRPLFKAILRSQQF